MTSEEREAYANYCISIMAKNFQSKGYVIKENGLFRRICG
jgi:hypothetical protein